jgi:hypothetical protein
MMASAAVGPTMTFQTVFDVAHEGYGAWWFPAIGLVLVLVGGLLVLNPTLAILVGIWGRQKLFSRVFLGFSVLWTVMTFGITYNEYRAATTALKEGRYSIAEGPVANFVSGPKQESFTVGNRSFSYSDDIVTTGFRHTASHGGPIHEGLYVRVMYVGNLILRLEIVQ